MTLFFGIIIHSRMKCDFALVFEQEITFFLDFFKIFFCLIPCTLFLPIFQNNQKHCDLALVCQTIFEQH